MTERLPALPERVRRVAHVAQRRVGDEVVVLDLRRSRVYGFNPAAGALLERLREGASTAALLAAARENGLEESTLVEFLADVLGRELLKGEPAPAGEAGASPTPIPIGGAPRLLWQEEAARVTADGAQDAVIASIQANTVLALDGMVNLQGTTVRFELPEVVAAEEAVSVETAQAEP